MNYELFLCANILVCTSLFPSFGGGRGGSGCLQPLPEREGSFPLSGGLRGATTFTFYYHPVSFATFNCHPSKIGGEFLVLPVFIWATAVRLRSLTARVRPYMFSFGRMQYAPTLSPFSLSPFSLSPLYNFLCKNFAVSVGNFY